MIDIYKQLRIWILFSWSFLTVGILLGSWWAYHELGWGGWWFWDPVENASLMPWLLATAGIHSIIRKELHPWAFFCIQSTFIFSILGTFFVRSGLLSSVHSFATDSTRGFYLLIFLLFLFSISMHHWIYSILSPNNLQKLKKKKKSCNKLLNKPFIVVEQLKSPLKRPRKDFTKSLEQLLILQNFYFCAICSIVFCGTTAPLIFQWFWNREIITGASFYNGTLIPLFTSVFFIFIYAHYLQFFFKSTVNYKLSNQFYFKFGKIFSHLLKIKEDNSFQLNGLKFGNKKQIYSYWPFVGTRDIRSFAILYFLIYFIVHLLIGVMVFELNVLNSIYIAICFLFISCVILSQYENIISMYYLIMPFCSLPNKLLARIPSRIGHNFQTTEGPLALSFKSIHRFSKKEMNIAHTGLVFLILGILFSNAYKFEHTEQLNPGSSGIRLGSQICYLRSIDHSFAPTFHSICANLIISQEVNRFMPSATNLMVPLKKKNVLVSGVENNFAIHFKNFDFFHKRIQSNDAEEANRIAPILCMFPEKRFYYSNQNIVASKVSIYSNLFTDFYSVIGTGSVDTGWFTTIMKLPFIFCIWLGFTFAVIGSTLRLIKLFQKPKLLWF